MSPSRVLALVLFTSMTLPGCRFLHRGHAEHAEHAEPERPPAIDLNTASLRRVEELPGVTPSMARRIVEGRPYGDPRELVERGILTERELDRILDRVTVKHRDN
jgi:DNA uptake protein ComE-like DNA-binding protein